MIKIKRTSWRRIFLFDVDGTLTPPRTPMTPEFASLFRGFVKTNYVYLVSGSDISKIREQIPEDILRECKGIFGSSANEFWIDDKKQYENVFVPSQEIVTELERLLLESNYKGRTNNHIEYRPGMINFSILGRSANKEQRHDYARWDKRMQERKRMAVNLMTKYPEIDVKVGGEISIDIYPWGLDKSQAVEFIRETHPTDTIAFFGDRTDEDGNDYSVVKVMDENDIVHAVENYEDTYTVLKEYIGGRL
jgi:phosphomannomutase